MSFVFDYLVGCLFGFFVFRFKVDSVGIVRGLREVIVFVRVVFCGDGFFSYFYFLREFRV